LHGNIGTPSSALTLVRTPREADDTTINNSERVVGLSAELERVECDACTGFSDRLEHSGADNVSTSRHTKDLDATTFEKDDQDETPQRGPPVVDLINRMSTLSSIARVVISLPKECKSRFDKMKSESWQPNIHTPFNEIKRAARSITKVSAPDASSASKDNNSMKSGDIFDYS
jgi:hypothetical protein